MVVACICTLAALAGTVQASEPGTLNTLSRMKMNRFGLVHRVVICGNVSTPRLNTEDPINILWQGRTTETPYNGRPAPEQYSVCQECESDFYECAGIDVECIGYVWHNSKRLGQWGCRGFVLGARLTALGLYKIVRSLLPISVWMQIPR